MLWGIIKFIFFLLQSMNWMVRHLIRWIFFARVPFSCFRECCRNLVSSVLMMPTRKESTFHLPRTRLLHIYLYVAVQMPYLQSCNLVSTPNAPTGLLTRSSLWGRQIGICLFDSGEDKTEMRWAANMLAHGKVECCHLSFHDFSALCHDLRPPSFVHHEVRSSYISKQFDLESLNFPRTSVPVCCTSTPDLTSIATSSWKISQKKQRFDYDSGIRQWQFVKKIYTLLYSCMFTWRLVDSCFCPDIGSWFFRVQVGHHL